MSPPCEKRSARSRWSWWPASVTLTRIPDPPHRAHDHRVLVAPPVGGPEADVQIGLREREQRPQVDAAVDVGVEVAAARGRLLHAGEAFLPRHAAVDVAERG